MKVLAGLLSHANQTGCRETQDLAFDSGRKQVFQLENQRPISCVFSNFLDRFDLVPRFSSAKPPQVSLG
jgi:hypothetical protein